MTKYKVKLPTLNLLLETVHWDKNPEFCRSDNKCRTLLNVNFRNIPKICWIKSVLVRFWRFTVYAYSCCLKKRDFFIFVHFHSLYNKMKSKVTPFLLVVQSKLSECTPASACILWRQIFMQYYPRNKYHFFEGLRARTMKFCLSLCPIKNCLTC